mmetsp:Transcript_56128/g.111416  ORF Transcript_56128/g.111416 Transcript_56128/m.111416 type:complete len:250 (+) Transcript_56128:521-1270(+)
MQVWDVCMGTEPSASSGRVRKQSTISLCGGEVGAALPTVPCVHRAVSAPLAAGPVHSMRASELVAGPQLALSVDLPCLDSRLVVRRHDHVCAILAAAEGDTCEQPVSRCVACHVPKLTRGLLHRPHANRSVLRGGGEEVVARRVHLERVDPARVGGDGTADGARHKVVHTHLPSRVSAVEPCAPHPQRRTQGGRGVRQCDVEGGAVSPPAVGLERMDVHGARRVSRANERTVGIIVRRRARSEIDDLVR